MFPLAHTEYSYPGTIALEDIGDREVIIRVPGKCIISTEKAFHSHLKPLFLKHPRLFSKAATRYWEGSLRILQKTTC